MNLKPLGDRIVVQRQEAGEKTKGGIILPDSAKEKPQMGSILAVGDGKILKDGKRQPLQLKKGDTVLFTSYAGDEFKLDGEKVVHEERLLKNLVGRIRDVRVGPDGLIYLLTDEANGALVRVEPAP